MKLAANKTSLIIALTLIALCFVVYSLIHRAEITPAPAAPNITGIQPNNELKIQSFSYAGTPFEPPRALDVYASQPTTPTQDLAAGIAALLNLTPTDQAGLWTNTETGDVLSLSRTDKVIQYSNALQAHEVAFTEDLVAKSIEASTDFLKKLGFGERLTSRATNVVYFTGAGELVPNTMENSNVAAIPYSLTIAGNPVFFESSTSPLAVVWVDSTQQILKAEFFSVPPNMSKQTTSQTYSLAEAMENMKNGRGTLVSTQLVEATYNISDIASAEFTKVTVEYRFTESSLLYYPYYHFIGTGKTKEGGMLGVEIITPAVK